MTGFAGRRTGAFGFGFESSTARGGSGGCVRFATGGGGGSVASCGCGAASVFGAAFGFGLGVGVGGWGVLRAIVIVSIACFSRSVLWTNSDDKNAPKSTATAMWKARDAAVARKRRRRSFGGIGAGVDSGTGRSGEYAS